MSNTLKAIEAALEHHRGTNRLLRAEMIDAAAGFDALASSFVAYRHAPSGISHTPDRGWYLS